jgi:hypothetical protein
VLQELLSAAQTLPLYPELALLHSRAGNHTAALLLLALLPPRLVEGAIAYCRCGRIQHGSNTFFFPALCCSLQCKFKNEDVWVCSCVSSTVRACSGSNSCSSSLGCVHC